MATPTYDGKQLFSYQDSNSNWRTEGVCFVPDYSKTTQKLHFNGENGNRYLDHGYEDQHWTFRGYLWSSSLGGLTSAITAIETYIDKDPGDFDSYKALQDTFGNSYTFALITKLNKTDVRIAADGWLAQVVVEGVICGNIQDSATGSTSLAPATTNMSSAARLRREFFGGGA